MSFRVIEQDLGYGPTEWMAPGKDEKIEGVLANVYEIDEWLHLCDGFDVAVQAGGNIGVWPSRMAQTFGTVYTFEPQPENYACLVENIQDDNIIHSNRGLSNSNRKVSVHQLDGQKNNYGAGYIVDDENGIEAICIDDLELSACDLICIDIEGAELEALQGAEKTIREHHPLVVLEDKPMPQLNVFNRGVGAPGKWLESLGYKYVMKQRWDSIYKWG